jgi:hypothetical protein
MEKLTVFTHPNQVLKQFDNGGRFFDFASSPEDGIITSGEIGRVAGIFGNKQKKVLYLALAINALDGADKERILDSLSDDMTVAYNKYLPQELTPSEALAKGVASSNAIITGVPTLVDSRKALNGFVIVPIATGKAVSMIMIPIIERYDVYELRDDVTSQTFLIAHAKGEGKLPETKVKVAGVLKELKLKVEGKEKTEIFLEALYYCE